LDVGLEVALFLLERHGAEFREGSRSSLEVFPRVEAFLQLLDLGEEPARLGGVVPESRFRGEFLFFLYFLF
jgi:hypothetical protein